jgi:hypothetical protein
VNAPTAYSRRLPLADLTVVGDSAYSDIELGLARRSIKVAIVRSSRRKLGPGWVLDREEE